MLLALRRFAPLLFCLALPPGAHAGVLKDHPGHWMGELIVPEGPPLKFGVEIFTRADGSAWASVASPDQGAFDIPVAGVTESGNQAVLDVTMAKLSLTWTGDRFDGKWTQGGETLPVRNMSKVRQFPGQVRPQTPVAPFPYSEQSVAIPASSGVTLGATLTVPRNAVKPVLVVLVHGSGPHTRDEHMAGHRPFAVLADHLARQGIAVLRYDKRGVARSTGDYAGHTQAGLASDLHAVLKAMRARGQFRKVGVLGHSEGPMIAADVLQKDPKAADFLISLAGVGLKGKDLIVLQDRLLAQDRGASPAEVERLAAFASRFYDIVIANADVAPRVAALKELRKADQALIDKYKMNEGSLSIGMAEQPALRVILLADPAPAWRAVKVPVLALNGSKDRQVPPESLAAIVSALAAGGNRRVESAIVPSLNHMLQTADTGAETEYTRIDETVAPVVLQRVAGFVKQQR